MLRVHEIERSRVAKVGQMDRCLDDVIKRGAKLSQHTLNIRASVAIVCVSIVSPITFLS